MMYTSGGVGETVVDFTREFCEDLYRGKYICRYFEAS